MLLRIHGALAKESIALNETIPVKSEWSDIDSPQTLRLQQGSLLTWRLSQDLDRIFMVREWRTDAKAPTGRGILAMDKQTLPNPFLYKHGKHAGTPGLMSPCLMTDVEGNTKCIAGQQVFLGSYVRAHSILQNEPASECAEDRTRAALDLAEVELLLGANDAAELNFLSAYQSISQAYGTDDIRTCRAAEGLVLLWSKLKNIRFLSWLPSLDALCQQRVLGVANLWKQDKNESAQTYADKAVQLAHNSLLVRHRTFGPDHPETARGWFITGHALYSDAPDAAYSAFLRARTILENSEYSRTNAYLILLAETLEAMSRCLLRRQQLEKALFVLEQAGAIYNNLLNEDHPIWCQIYLNLGRIRERMQDAQSAQTMYRAAVCNTVLNCSRHHLNAYNEECFDRLRRLLHQSKKYDEIANLFQCELEIMAELPSEQKKETEKLRQALSYFKANRLREQMQKSTEQLATVETTVRTRDMRRQSICTYAETLLAEGNFVAAEMLFREVGFSETNPGPLASLFDLRKKFAQASFTVGHILTERATEEDVATAAEITLPGIIDLDALNTTRSELLTTYAQ